jgi:SAM-dependent methyltransferase
MVNSNTKPQISGVDARIAGVHQFWVDDPAALFLETPYSSVQGWVQADRCPAGLSIALGSSTLQTAWYRRPDLPQDDCWGFTSFVDFPSMHEACCVPQGRVPLCLQLDGKTAATIEMGLSHAATRNLAALVENRDRMGAFVRKHADRPLAVVPGCKAPSGLPDDWAIDPKITSKSDPVSAHFYSSVIHKFIADLGPGAVVLDAGAGFRKAPVMNVVHLEIYDYPSTHVLGVGQRLPFRDNVFDGALSLAVLEHVDDPFLCAKELLRVVKPGGKIFAMVPFLQAEHGYPSHFFNCTRFGLRKLFSNAKVIDQFLEFSNHPICTLNQVLGWYACGLPPVTREAFLDMKVRELVATSPNDPEARNRDYVALLDDEFAWKLAWGTTAVFEKTV